VIIPLRKLKELLMQRSETLNAGTLLVSEIFSSIQGEGINLGAPSVFLRLAVCNLHCWYCDTKYTWLYNEKMLQTVRAYLKALGIKESQFPGDLHVYEPLKEVKRISLQEVESRILFLGINHLVVTGGEPVLQQTQLTPLFRRLKRPNSDEKDPFYIEIETNGTIKPSREILPLVDQWNVSPKLSTSGNSEFAREKKEPLETFARLGNTFFKFVVSAPSFEQDLREIQELSSGYKIPPSRIMLMPEGTDASILKERMVLISKVCEKLGYRVTPRLHILLWGNQRGT
jgi:7-carboxy-7-deazaguanine synthase